ncbi:ModD protein [Siccirubricoccus sp. KC 17139]|uniref:Putative pyrophosphorylase ModD n=1 Tax=Siccirubricoccus soli TaxID=2899147 RepID=A0ABT1D468_9PROT|nr:ModD protein [Siccirubricoccus soli]MCO6416723.1 ModD protein [Siccirubricoccus soli]MCP2682858.1 ModD protein [Siccirubricoccus soli]
MSYPLPDARLAAMLAEDAPHGDLTTAGLGIGERPGRLVLRARDTMTLACIEEAERLFQLAACAETRRYAASGAQVEAGGELLRAAGPAAALHRAAKVAQVLVEIASGIASRAHAMVQAARSARPGIAVACTRKHLPGAKDVMLRAIAAGGCIPHRLGLSDSVLVFPEHRAFLGRTPPHLWVASLRAAQPERKIAVEADSIDLALQFAHAGVDTLQLDKLPPEDVGAVARALSGMARRPLLVATGGVNAANAAAYAAAGADLLVTSAPYAAPPADVAVTMSAVDR